MNEQCYKVTLVCFNCGCKKDVLVDRPIQFAFELADIARQAGMYGVIDMSNRRSLVFCNEDCANKQKTKSGTFRVKPKQFV